MISHVEAGEDDSHNTKEYFLKKFNDVNFKDGEKWNQCASTIIIAIMILPSLFIITDDTVLDWLPEEDERFMLGSTEVPDHGNEDTNSGEFVSSHLPGPVNGWKESAEGLSNGDHPADKTNSAIDAVPVPKVTGTEVTTTGTRGNIIIVDPAGNEDYTTIQDAIDNANDGDTIKVWDGTYTEILSVGRSLDIIGNGSSTTIVDGEGLGDHGMFISADNVNISGLSIVNNEYHGIKINSSHVRVSNSNLSDNLKCGVAFIVESESGNNTVEGCDIWNNQRYGIALQGTGGTTLIANNTIGNSLERGISITQGDENDVVNNTITGGDHGIVIESMGGGERNAGDEATEASVRNSVRDNTISRTLGSGMNIQQSCNDNEIIGNTITSCGEDWGEYGISFSGVSGAVVMDNSITSCGDDFWGGGIQFESSESIVFERNTIDSCYNGFYLSEATGIDSFNDTIEDSKNSDIVLDRDANIRMIGSSFDTGKVDFNDETSILEMGWFATVYVETAGEETVEYAYVEIRDTDGAIVARGSTDANGLLSWVPVREYVLTYDGTEYSTPHNITANSDTHRGWADPEPTFDESLQVNITLELELPLIEEIRILYGNGKEVGELKGFTGDRYSFWAAGYDIDEGFVRYVSADWSSNDTSVGTVVEGPGYSTNVDIVDRGTFEVTAEYDSFEAITGTITSSWKVWNLNSDEYYDTIQGAIDDATPGDTIWIGDTEFHEHILIEIEISLVGAGSGNTTIIDGDGEEENVIRIEANDVFISDLRIVGSGTDESGISIGADRTNITDCWFEDNGAGITIGFANGNTIENCVFKNMNNGIYISNGEYNVIRDNDIAGIDNYGIRFYNSMNNEISDNSLSECSSGIYFYNGDKNTISGNTLENCGNGIYLYLRSDSNAITDNVITSNAHGIYIWNTVTKNIITTNRITDNSNSGITIKECFYNTIYDNYFENTKNAVADRYNYWEIDRTNGTNIVGGPYIGGNYWSDYGGKDNDGDGLGDTDTPYDSNGDIEDGGDSKPLMKEVTIPPEITSSTPPTSTDPSSSPVNDSTIDSRSFSITINQTVDVVWNLDGEQVYTESDVTTSTYTNSTPKEGTWNITVEVENANGTDTVSWEWNVVEPVVPTIIDSSPSSPVYDLAEKKRNFTISADQTVNVSWKIGNRYVLNETGVTTSTYSNGSAVLGNWTITVMITNRNGTDSETWDWAVLSEAKVHNTDTNKDFPSIQAAIDDTDTLDGHTITIDDGMLSENAVIHKSVTITSSSGDRSKTTITAKSLLRSVLRVSAENVTITDLTITDAFSILTAGIWFQAADNGTVANCTLTGNVFGILLNATDNVVIRDVLSENSVGILLRNSDSNHIIGNTITDTMGYGIWLDKGSDGNQIELNNVSECGDEGIRIYFSDSNTIRENEIAGNDNDGISVMGSRNCVIEENHIQNNEGHGIYIFLGTTGTRVENNELAGNTGDGIIIAEYSHENSILNNTITGSRKNGINVDSYSDRNIVESNSITSSGESSLVISYGDDTRVMNNTLSGGQDGLLLIGAENATIIGSTIGSHIYPIRFIGFTLHHYTHIIPTSNEVDGKPVYYWVGKEDMQIPTDGGFYGIVDSTNITVRDLNMSGQYHGVLMAYSSTCVFENVTAMGNFNGIHLIETNDSWIRYCDVSENVVGVFTQMSSGNILENSTMSRNLNSGLFLRDDSLENSITECEIDANVVHGIMLIDGSDSNMISGNTFTSNGAGVRIISASDGNRVTGNLFDGNGMGISIYSASETLVRGNTVVNGSNNGISVSQMDSENTRIENNRLEANENGIALFSNRGSTVANNTVLKNHQNGIDLQYAHGNLILNNTVSQNAGRGISVWYSGGNTFRDNAMSNNTHDLHVDGSSISDKWDPHGDIIADHEMDMDTSNTVNGKPVYYWVGESDRTVPATSGFVGLVGCSNITVRDLELERNGIGILVVNSTWTHIENITVRDTIHGIQIILSSNTTVFLNEISENQLDGIELFLSQDTIIRTNTISMNGGVGVRSRSSSGTMIYDNILDNTLNAHLFDSEAIWNISKTLGTNILGGKYLGGNWWNGYIGEDLDGDALGDTLLPHPFTNGDLLPLVRSFDHDIGITGLEFPSDILIGTDMTVNVTVANIGRNDEVNITVRFLVNGKEEDFRIIDLDHADSQVVSFTWTSPVIDGVYNLSVEAVPVLNETYVANNARWNVTEVYVITDIRVDDLEWTPVNGSDGEEYLIATTITNNGDTTTHRTFSTSILVDGADGISYFTFEVEGLDSGESIEISRTWIASPGNHTIYVTADAGDIIRETDADNNLLNDSLFVPYPDLVVSDITWTPATIEDGNAVTFTANITNEGERTLREFRITFRIDGSVVGTKYVDGLNAGESVSIGQVWRAEPGEHSVSALADSQYRVRESNETNNLLEVDLPEVMLSDLMVVEVTGIPEPGNITLGQHIYFKVTVKNIGTANTTQRFYTGIKLDGVCIGKEVVYGLDAGETMTVPITWVATGGSHSITAWADPDDFVTETNESNNNRTYVLPVAPLPDLVVTDITLSDADPAIGEEIVITITVENTGIGDILSTFDVVVYVGDAIFGTEILYGIASNGTIVLNLTERWPVCWCANRITVVVDDVDDIIEQNETNNDRIVVFTVTDGSPPVIESISPTNESIVQTADSIEVLLDDELGFGVDLAGSTVTVREGEGGPTITGTLGLIEDVFVFTPEDAFGDGNYSVTIEALDNESNSITYTTWFIIDGSEPEISVTGVEHGQSYQTTVVPVIDITDENPDSITILLNGMMFVGGTTISNEGYYELYIQTRDLAGNNAETMLSFTIDLAPLAPTGLRVERQDTTADLTWNPNLEDDIEGYHIYRDGGRITTQPIQGLSFRDTGLDELETYEYSITAVDAAGQESPEAEVTSITIGLVDYGTGVDGDPMLTEGYPDVVIIGISNGAVGEITVETVTIEIINSFGEVTGTGTNDEDNVLQEGENGTVEVIILTERGTHRLRVTVTVDGIDSIRTFEVNSRTPPEQPVDLHVDTVIEGYGNLIAVNITNYGSANLSVDPMDISIELFSIESGYLCTGGVLGTPIIVGPGEMATLDGILVVPMAIGVDIHLDNLTIHLEVPTSYDENEGGTEGWTYLYSEDVPNYYITIPPLALYHPQLVKDSTRTITLVYVNQGTVDLQIAKQDVIVTLRNEDDDVLSSNVNDDAVGRILPGSTHTFTFDLTIPTDAPDYVFVWAELTASALGLGNEADDVWYFEIAEASTIPLPYDANATTDKAVYCNDDEVVITGTAFDVNGTAIPDTLVEVRILTRGYTRRFYAFTDANGSYTYTFDPLPNEGGYYTISAGHPSSVSVDIDATFEILGLMVDPLTGKVLEPYGLPVNIQMYQTDEQTLTLTVNNAGESELSGIVLTIQDNEADDDVTLTAPGDPFDLEPGKHLDLPLTITSSGTQAANASFLITITCDQGCEETAQLRARFRPNGPIIWFTPRYLQTGVAQEDILFESFSLSNTGSAPWENVRIADPPLPWVSVITGLSPGDIAIDSGSTVDLMIAPSISVQPGVYWCNLTFESDNLVDQVFPMVILVTSGQTGHFSFEFRDVFGDPVRNLEVTICDQETYTTVLTAWSNETGFVLFTGIPAGWYSYRTHSDNYYIAAGDARVNAGSTTVVEEIISSSYFSYSWSVVPSDFPDVYDTVHNVTYDSRAPVPYLDFEQEDFWMMLMPGEIFEGQINITNRNEIVSAFNVRPMGRTDDELTTVEFLIDVIPEIKPGETVIVPYVIKLAEHHSMEPVPCEETKIVLWTSAEAQCIGCWYDRYDKLSYCDFKEVETDELSISMHPACWDAIKKIPWCALDLIEIYTGAIIVIEGLKIPKYAAFLWKAKSFITDLYKCIRSSACGWWPLADCYADLYGNLPLPAGNCLQAALGFVKCKFQDTCCKDTGSGTEETPWDWEGECTTCSNAGYGDLRFSGFSDYVPLQYGPCKSSPETMCIRTQLEISQDQTLERQGFDAQLELKNMLPDYDMRNMSVQVNFTDEEGNRVDDLFFTTVLSSGGLRNLENGDLYAGNEADIRWLFVPVPGAGGNESSGRGYIVNAYIEYYVKNVKFSFETYPAPITVFPMPILTLDYMLPKEVIGDDPSTMDTVEPAEPFMWGVRVQNIGHGDANEFSIDTAQPKIISATAGTFVDFQLLGTFVNGEQVDGTLQVDFGTLGANSSATAGWLMACSLSGNFTNYTASFTHAAAYGGQATSLIQNITTHVLIHQFMNDRPGADGMFDFLVDENDDGIPDLIIDSEGMDEPVMAIDVNITRAPTPEDPTIDISLTDPTNATGWIFMRIEHGLSGTIEGIPLVARSDDNGGNDVPLSEHNVWTRNGVVYIVDHIPDDGSGSSGIEYEIILNYNDTTAPRITNQAATPAVQFVNGTVNITCVITDDVVVEIALVNITTPGGTTMEVPMVGNHGTSDEYSLEDRYAEIGIYDCFIRTIDRSGNENTSEVFTFEIVEEPDISAPEISNVTATPDPQEVYGTVNITCEVRDDRILDSVWVAIEAPAGGSSNVSMSTGPGDQFYHLDQYISLGNYTFSIHVVDSSGNWNDSAVWKFEIVDTTLPVFGETLATPSIQESGGNVNLTTSISDNVEVTGFLVTIEWPDTSVRHHDLDPAEPWYEQVFWIPGEYVYHFWAIDRSGNANVTADISFTVIDTTKPDISLVNATPEDQIIGGSVNITCNASDIGGIDKVMVKIEMGGKNAWYPMSSLYHERWFELTYDARGTYSFWIIANDTSGNSRVSEEGSFRINDVIDPVISGITTDPEVQIKGGIVNITCTVTDNDGDRLDSVHLRIVNPKGTVIEFIEMERYETTYHHEQIYATPGVWTYSINATDMSGNTIGSGDHSFTILHDEDTIPPTISDVAVDVTVQEIGEQVLITATVEDETALADARVILTPPGGPVMNMSMNEGSPFFLPLTFTGTGAYFFTIWALDANGNQQMSEIFTFEYRDTIAPVVVELDHDPEPQLVDMDVTFTYGATDTGMIKEFLLIIITPEGDVIAVSVPQGETEYTRAFDEPGTYQYRLRMEDESGNVRFSPTRTFGIDSEIVADGTAPDTSITIGTPSAHQDGMWRVTGETLISLIAIDNGSGVATTYFQLTPEGGTGDWNEYSMPISKSDPGLYTISWYSEDAQGNEEELNSLTFEVVEDLDTGGTGKNTDDENQLLLGLIVLMIMISLAGVVFVMIRKKR